MEQEIQPQQVSQNKKLPLVVAISVLLTALIAGAGVYFWQKSKLGASEQGFRQQTTSLENQLSELQSEYNTLKNQKSGSTNTSVGSILYDLISGRCTTDECLFNIGNSNYPLGTAVIKGYYSPVERSAWEETKKCDAFTITAGSKELIRAMVDLVDQGNTVHSKNQMNQPVINLGFELISQSEKQSIFNSSVNNQIELVVLSDSPRESGVPVCYQDVIVLRKK